MNAQKLLVHSELGLEVKLTFDGDGGLHEHSSELRQSDNMQNFDGILLGWGEVDSTRCMRV